MVHLACSANPVFWIIICGICFGDTFLSLRLLQIPRIQYTEFSAMVMLAGNFGVDIYTSGTWERPVLGTRVK